MAPQEKHYGATFENKVVSRQHTRHQTDTQHICKASHKSEKLMETVLTQMQQLRDHDEFSCREMRENNWNLQHALLTVVTTVVGNVATRQDITAAMSHHHTSTNTTAVVRKTKRRSASSSSSSSSASGSDFDEIDTVAGKKKTKRFQKMVLARLQALEERDKKSTGSESAECMKSLQQALTSSLNTTQEMVKLAVKQNTTAPNSGALANPPQKLNCTKEISYRSHFRNNSGIRATEPVQRIPSSFAKALSTASRGPLAYFKKRRRQLEEIQDILLNLFNFNNRKATLYEKCIEEQEYGVEMSDQYIPPVGESLEERITGLTEDNPRLQNLLELDRLHYICILFKHVGDDIIRTLKLAHREIPGHRHMFEIENLSPVSFTLSTWQKPATEVALTAYTVWLHAEVDKLLNSLTDLYESASEYHQTTQSAPELTIQKRKSKSSWSRSTSTTCKAKPKSSSRAKQSAVLKSNDGAASSNLLANIQLVQDNENLNVVHTSKLPAKVTWSHLDNE